jgi:hypothetical protein
VIQVRQEDLPISEGQMSDHKGPDLIYPMLPDAETLIAEKGI